MGRKSVYIVALMMCLVTDCCFGLNNSSENMDTQSKVNKEVGNHHRAKDKSQSNEGMMEKMLPLLIIPFLISSAIIPIMLKSIKILLVKSFVVGKIAVILMVLNFFRRRADRGGVYDHYVDGVVAEQHYGYKGIEEPGVYVHKRRRRRRHIL